jgi:hypothetical protein
MLPLLLVGEEAALLALLPCFGLPAILGNILFPPPAELLLLPVPLLRLLAAAALAAFVLTVILATEQLLPLLLLRLLCTTLGVGVDAEERTPAAAAAVPLTAVEALRLPLLWDGEGEDRGVLYAELLRGLLLLVPPPPPPPPNRPLGWPG